jgi:hypothetical protein
MHVPARAEPTETGVFDEIVRAARKEHLRLTLRTVRDERAGLAMVVVSGPRYAAGYRAGASWPERFRAHLAQGLFD